MLLLSYLRAIAERRSQRRNPPRISPESFIVHRLHFYAKMLDPDRRIFVVVVVVVVVDVVFLYDGM